jgi:hypothetical protein
LKENSISFRGIFVQNVLANYVLQKCVPKYLHDLKKLKEYQGVIENLKCGLTNHLGGQKSSSMVMVKDSVCVLATSNKTSNNRQVVQSLGVDRRNIKRATKRRHTLDNNGDAFWLQKRTGKRVDVLCETAIQQIVCCILDFRDHYFTK